MYKTKNTIPKGSRKALVIIMKQEFKVLPGIPNDFRLKADRHTNSVLPMTLFASKQKAEERREELKQSVLMAAGLYPLPERTPMNVKTEFVGEFDGYSVKKIMFETRPGFWSTGNLYMPKNINGKAPALLNVIGHWEPQRIFRDTDADYPRQLANFARMGFVCLVTDMIGWVDSRQIDHYYGGNEKDLYASNGLGIQLWNNIRAVDLLCDMPEVDEDLIGVTGASGGGSQSLFLSIADERIKAIAPINMISLHMQGGCQCENAAGLRINTDNAEMCAMLAPRPLFLAGSTGDWTKNLGTVEYPAILDTYKLYNAQDNVEYYYQVADHQYNEKTRKRVYSFFAKHLMGKDIVIEEAPIEVKDVSTLTWFGKDGRPEGIFGDDEFFSVHKKERIASVEKLGCAEKKALLRWTIGEEKNYIVSDANEETIKGAKVYKMVINGRRGQQIPFVKIVPDNWDGESVCAAFGGNGKNCLEKQYFRTLIDGGVCVISGDIFMTGEYEGAEIKINGGDTAKKYFTTFHYTVDAYRAQDIELLWKYAKTCGSKVSLWADGCAARAASCVLPLLDGVQKAELEGKALEISGDRDYFDNFFIPSILSLQGIEGCLRLADCDIVRF